MTDEEKYEQAGRLIFEHQQAQKELAHLREKAARLAQALLQAGDWLKRASTGQPRFGNEEPIRESLNEALFAEALKLIDEISATEKRVADLASRKNALGLE